MRILYLDLDALNPSHLSCYGYARATSPAIDAIAGDGLRCTNVYCSDAPCLPSRTAFYQGRFGIQTGVVGHGDTAADPKRQGKGRGFRSVYEEESLPRKLQHAGFHTAMVSPFGQRHAAHHFYAGFNEVHNSGGCGADSAELVTPTLHRWLDDHAAQDRWYLHVNFWDIHTYCRVPASFKNPFEKDPLPDYFTQALLDEHIKRPGPHSAQDLGMYEDADVARYPRCPARITDMTTLKQWIDCYDLSIRYVDDCVAVIVEKLKAAGVYEDTVIVISADHGENNGHLGIYGEHGTADHATCNIPFIVRWPNVTKPSVDEGLHYHLDWAPTLLELLGEGKRIPDIWDGESFTKTVKDNTPQGRDQLVVSQCAHVCQRSVRFDQGAPGSEDNAGSSHRWLYMRTYHDGFHPFPKHMLYDLAADPLESHNLAEERPDVVNEASARLLAWHDDQMVKMTEYASDSVDPLWTVMRESGPFHGSARQFKDFSCDFPGYLDRLEKTGRKEGADDLRQRYPELLEA